MAELRDEQQKVVEKLKVAPATTRDTSLPLSFLDLLVTGPIYVKSLFFYQFSHDTHIFYETTLPTLKHSLSLTLQHFFPLAGNLISPPSPHKPFIRCTHDDTVNLTIVESKHDFNHLSSNHPKNLKDLNHLVPKLTFTTTHDGNYVFPMVALQITVFPNHGLCIAITNSHAILDCRSSCYFMKTWSSICQSGGVDLPLVENSLPCFDREVIKDPKGLETIFLRDFFERRSTWKNAHVHRSAYLVDDDYVKATITFGRDDIESLRRWVLKHWGNNDEFKAPQYLSKFVVTFAFVWTSLVKAKFRFDDDNNGEEMKDEYFYFGADCRDRFEYPIPATYVGNCLTRCIVILKRKDLKGESGLVNAVKGITRVITDMKTEPLKGAENWKELDRKMFASASTVVVTGSSKVSLYQTDFGFGKPTKFDMIHTPVCVSLAESGDKGEGLEHGFILKREEFEYFNSLIEKKTFYTKIS